jgi:membrane protein
MPTAGMRDRPGARDRAFERCIVKASPAVVAGSAYVRTDLLARLNDYIWGTSLQALPRARAGLLRVVRTAVVLLRDITQGQLTLRAMSLVYTTLLSIVPLLALSFSVLKGFGVYNQIEPMLLGVLEPLGENGEEITHRIIEFIQNMNVRVLGAAGLALLIYTSISLIQKIEESFNFIWHIAQPRRFGERFSRYLSVLLVGPLLVFSAMGITATVASASVVAELMTIEPFGRIVYVVTWLMPYLLVIGAFTFAYLFIPNTRVRIAAALIGGIFGGVLWQTAGWIFAEFIASSTRYTAIYSGFAVLILFMIWLYLSWLILLAGASVSFYVQRPEYLIAEGGEPQLSNRMREALALSAMSLVARRFVGGQPALSLEALTHSLGVPMNALRGVLDALDQANLLTQTSSEPPAYLPAQDPASIPVQRVLDTVRAAGEGRHLAASDLQATPCVDRLLRRIQDAMDASVAGLSVADLARTVTSVDEAPLPREPKVTAV